MMMPAEGIAAGERHTYAVALQKEVTCWGSNHAGQLEGGRAVDRVTPHTVSGLASGMCDQW